MLGKSHKMEATSDMTIAADWDGKHQFKQTRIRNSVKYTNDIITMSL